VIGSALVVGVVSTLLNAAAFVGAMHAQPSNFG